MDSRAAARLAASAGRSPQRESATVAMSRQPRAVSRPQRGPFPRRPDQHDGQEADPRGQAPARQPQRPIAETGAGTATDSTKTRTAAVPPAAK